METLPLLGREGAPTSPNATKYRYKRRPMVKFLGKLRDALSNCWFVFHGNNTSWEDSVEFDASNKKAPSSGSRSMSCSAARTSRGGASCFQEDYQQPSMAMSNKKSDRRTRGTDDRVKGRSQQRDAVHSQEDESMKTCNVSDEESNDVKRVRFSDYVEQRTAQNNFHVSEPPILGGAVSIMRPTFPIITSWHVPLRHGLSALKDRIQSAALMLPPTGDRSGAFPTADGAFPIFVPNNHEMN